MIKAGKLTLNVVKTRNLLNKRRNYQPMLSSIVVSDNSEFFPEKSREICRTLSLESLYSRRNFLASGSFGEVHRVIRRSDGKCMAMKVVDLKEAHHNEHDMPVIIRRHKPSTDSVITVDQVFVERNQMFIVFDLMKGMDMLDYLLEIGPVSEELSSRLMIRILNCVKDCHDSGVAHLDVKPDNLMFRHEAKDGKIENINPEDLVLVELRSGNLLHARAEVVLSMHYADKSPTIVVDANADYPFKDKEYYSNGQLFHGPALQCIDSISACSANTISGQVQTAPLPSDWMSQPMRSSWLADPMILDASFQMMILWSFQQTGTASLPTKITSYRQFQRKFPKQGAELNINIVSSSKHAASADIEILDKQNKLLARIEGYECVIDSSLNNAFKKNTLEVPAKA